jgi:hypothetical protein
MIVMHLSPARFGSQRLSPRELRALRARWWEVHQTMAVVSCTAVAHSRCPPRSAGITLMC